MEPGRHFFYMLQSSRGKRKVNRLFSSSVMVQMQEAQVTLRRPREHLPNSWIATMFWALQSLKGLNCIIPLSPRVKFGSLSAPGCILSPLWCRSPFKASGTSGKGLGHSLVVKNVPSNAGDAGSIPGGELDPMCHGAITQLKATGEADILQPDWAHALQQEKAYTPQWRSNAEKRERIQEGDSPYLQLLCSSHSFLITPM